MNGTADRSSATATADRPATVDGSVIFSDLVGFTAFNGARGDAAAVDVLDRHRGYMDGAIDGEPGARVVKELGDGLLAWSPTGSGGLRIASAFLAMVLAARDGGDFPLAVRIGLHHGTVSKRGEDLVGQTVNIAARIVDLAGPSEILMSDAVVDECGDLGAFGCQAVGPVTVKGVTEAVWLYRVDVTDG